MRYWMVDTQRVPQGPFERDEIVRRIGAEAIEPTRLVCPEGGSAWVEIRSEFPGVFLDVHPSGAMGLQPAAPSAPPTTRPMGQGPHGGAPTGPGTVGYLVPLSVEPCSLAAGYLGLLSPIGGVLAPFALGFAIAGLVRLRKRPHLRGHVRCAIGIVGGLIGLVIGVALLASSFG